MTFPYPQDLHEFVRLPSQLTIHVRPLLRGDEHSIRELDRRLSPRTRYLRFFLPMRVLPKSLLSLLASVDYQRRLALLAEVNTSHGTEVVALGSYGASDDGTTEVALVVGDEWQRRGIGVAIAARVMQAAEARGFDRFVAFVLYENAGIRKFLHHVGHVVSTKTRDGVSEVSFTRRRLPGA